MNTSFLPATNYSLAQLACESIRELSAPKEGIISNHVSARIELIRLEVLSAIEIGVHLVTVPFKLAIAVVQIPLYLPFGGSSPFQALGEVIGHLVHVVKLAIAMVVGGAVGLLNPEWADGLYQNFSLVKNPIGIMSVISDLFKAAWSTEVGRSLLAGAGLTLAGVGICLTTWVVLKVTPWKYYIPLIPIVLIAHSLGAIPNPFKRIEVPALPV
jgi:hypothetical protein